MFSEDSYFSADSSEEWSQDSAWIVLHTGQDLLSDFLHVIPWQYHTLWNQISLTDMVECLKYSSHFVIRDESGLEPKTHKSSGDYYTDWSWYDLICWQALKFLPSNRLSTVREPRKTSRKSGCIHIEIRWWCCGTERTAEIRDIAEILHPCVMFK